MSTWQWTHTVEHARIVVETKTWLQEAEVNSHGKRATSIF